jgi:hypothetical protein
MIRLGGCACLLGAMILPPAMAGEFPSALDAGLEPAAIRKELSRSVEALYLQGPDVLRSHVERLTDLYADVERNEKIPPEERRAIGDRLLTRVAQAGLLLREGQAGSTIDVGWGRKTPRPFALSVFDGAAGLVKENPVLLVGLLGGVIVAFSLGGLAGYRRGASQASYYGGGDPRMRFAPRPPGGPMPEGVPVPITLPKIRETLAVGRTVLMQLGSEIASARRTDYLRLTREVRQILDGTGGRTYSVWEDPRHPNRFYELLICRRLDSLDLLSDGSGELAALTARIEACRLPGRQVQRRVWWAAIPEAGMAVSRLAAVGEPSASEGDGRS